MNRTVEGFDGCCDGCSHGTGVCPCYWAGEHYTNQADQCACGKFMVAPSVTLVDSDDVAHNVNACQPW